MLDAELQKYETWEELRKAGDHKISCLFDASQYKKIRKEGAGRGSICATLGRGISASQVMRALKLLRQIEEARGAHDAALESGQRWGAAALYAEARIGELLPSAEKAMSMGQQVRFGKLPGTRPEGVTARDATAARTIARHPEIVTRRRRTPSLPGRAKTALSRATPPG